MAPPFRSPFLPETALGLGSDLALAGRVVTEQGSPPQEWRGGALSPDISCQLRHPHHLCSLLLGGRWGQ